MESVYAAIQSAHCTAGMHIISGTDAAFVPRVRVYIFLIVSSFTSIAKIFTELFQNKRGIFETQCINKQHSTST